jgi:hypothetical protein
MEVTLLLQHALAPLAERLFPGARAVREGEATQVTVTATFLDGLLRYALSLSPECRVLAPEPAAARFGELARKIAEAHAHG